MIIENTPLPGIGTCHTTVTARRQRLGVVAHRTGRRDLVLYRPDDPQCVAHAVVLDATEARHVADLLATTTPVDHLAPPSHEQAGTSVACLRVPAGSPPQGRPLRDIQGRGGVDVRLVAVIRQDQITSAPGPGFVVRPGDALVVAGDPAAITALADLLGRDPGRSRRLRRRRQPSATGPPR